jgi:Mg2+-importing ATPase
MLTTVRDSIKTRFSLSSNGNGINEDTAGKLKNASRSDSNLFFSQFDSNAEGLSPEQVEEKLNIYGLNEVHHEKAPSWSKQLIQAFINPFIGVLLIIAIISFIVDVWMANPGEAEYKTVIVVGIMVMVSSLLRFFQEYRSNRAAEQLKSMVKTTATVLRKLKGKIELDIKELVPGDIIFLSAGDMIPADCRIIQSKDLFISQSMLTGESLPVEKRGLNITDAEKKLTLELENICFMGTNVVSGTATAMVVTTGDLTYFGSIGKAITGKRAETSFDKGINKVSWLLIRFMLVMVPLVFFYKWFYKRKLVRGFIVCYFCGSRAYTRNVADDSNSQPG